VPYTAYETPFGQGWIQFADGIPVRTGLPAALPPDEAFDANPPPGIAALREGLERYFSGKGPLPSEGDMIERAATTELTGRIYRRVAAIRPGQTMTYAAIAAAVGAPGAARAVGAAMARNKFAPMIPCHRVVGSDGSLRGYAGGIEMKRALLNMEAGRG
jgi:O-6-methylguanine DNA methyltransferase